MKYPVVDGHCDTPVELWRKGEALRENSGHISLCRAEKLPGYVQFYAFCTVWQQDADSFEVRFQKAISYFNRELDKNQDKILRCRNAADARAALESGRCGAFLSIEGAEALSCDPGKLEQAYAQGIRMIAPTWNFENALAGSCVTGGGLTAQGKEFVRRAQALGIIIDVSHISERAFWDICDIAEKPIVASHSNAKAVCGHARNLSDEQFRAICQLGGTAGLNLYGAFLRSEGTVSFEDVWRHIEHFLDLGGDGHIALGADLDGCDVLPEGFCGIESYEALGQYLETKKLSEAVIQNLYSESLLKVVKQCTM